MGVAAPGPQSHVAIRPPAVGAVQLANVVATALLHGAIRMVPSIPVPRFCEVTVMMPAASVAIDATCLLMGVADSQPQPPAAGSTVADCTVSVMAARHADAARMTSDTFAFTV